MDADYDRAARHLQLALSEGFAPQIRNEQSMKFAKGLRDGKTEKELGLTAVPIDVVYSAMFAFLKLQTSAWQPIEAYGNQHFGQKAIFYYPPVTNSPHPSNDKIAMISTERGHSRKPTMFMLVEMPE